MRALVRRVSARIGEAPARSAEHLDHHGRIALLTELRRMRRLAACARSEERLDAMRPELRRLFRLWGYLVRGGLVRATMERAVLRRFVRHHAGIDAPQWLKPSHCDLVAEALKEWLKYESAKQHLGV